MHCSHPLRVGLPVTHPFLLMELVPHQYLPFKLSASVVLLQSGDVEAQMHFSL